MLKTKYERMTKEEKQKLVLDYKKTEAGKAMCNRLLRLNVIGAIGVLYSIFLFFSDYGELKWYDYLLIVSLFLISIFFICMAYRLKKKVLNRFAIKK